MCFFYAPPSHLDGLKQPRRRELFNGPTTPKAAHVLVKQSFLNEGAVLETNGDAFGKSEQIRGSTGTHM